MKWVCYSWPPISALSPTTASDPHPISLSPVSPSREFYLVSASPLPFLPLLSSLFLFSDKPGLHSFLLSCSASPTPQPLKHTHTWMRTVIIWLLTSSGESVFVSVTSLLCQCLLLFLSSFSEATKQNTHHTHADICISVTWFCAANAVFMLVSVFVISSDCLCHMLNVNIAQYKCVVLTQY